MAQPVLYIIPSFDAAVGANINFAYEGEQVFANELVIYDNETGSQVYSKKTEWMRTYHVINGGVLQNGKYYYCEIRVFNKEGTASDWSSQKSFRCFTTPQFGFSNMLTDQIVQNSEITVRLNYSQAENEPLNTYTVGLYNANRVLITKSGTLYGVNTLEYTVKNLEDGTKYYLRATGETLNGMAADTGYVPFSVKFITPTYWTYVVCQRVPMDNGEPVVLDNTVFDDCVISESLTNSFSEVKNVIEVWGETTKSNYYSDNSSYENGVYTFRVTGYRLIPMNIKN